MNVTGRVRLFNNEIYILPEIVKVLDNPSWGKLRRLELVKLYGEVKQETIKQEMKTEEIPKHIKTEEIVIGNTLVEEIDFTKPETNTITETERQKVLNIIESSGDKGVRVMEVTLKTQLSEEQTQNIIRELVKEGEVYHPKPGYICKI